MAPRDTRTGSVLENMILPSLKQGGYQAEAQKLIGIRLGGSKHRVDVIAQKLDSPAILVSLKWQQESGTAEQKVPFEVICLIDAVRTSEIYQKAYIVLGGTGWKLRNFYINELETYIPHKQFVTIITLEDFIAKANKGRL